LSLPALPLPASLPRPPIKAVHRPARAPTVLQTAARRRSAYAPAPECPPALARAARSCAVQQFPHGLPTAQHHRALPARPERRQAEGRRGQPPWAPPAGRYPALSHPPAAPNRTLVPPRSPPCPSPTKPGGGSPEFGQPTPASRPRGYIAKTKIFPRASLQKGNSNSICDLADSCKLRRNSQKNQKNAKLILLGSW
jgi:hypothetical protein